MYSSIPKNKFKILILCILASSTLLFFACQSTPEDEVVINKSNSNLEDKVLDTADPDDEWTNTNERIVWNESKNVNTVIGECIINVSMDIDMPAYPGPVPVYLIEPAEFSLRNYESIVRYLMPGEIYDGRSSKQDIMLEILNAEKQIGEQTILDGNQSEIDNYFNYLYEEYDNASENNDAAKFEFIENEYGQSAVRIKSYLDDSTIMTFTGKHNRFAFRVNDLNIIYYIIDKTSQEDFKANGIVTTYEEALLTANNAMATLLEKPYAMVHACIADKKNDLEYLWSDEETSVGQAYVFYYSPEYGGFPSLYIDPASRTITEKTEYAKTYIREYALLVVDDRGIVYMTYDSISDVIKELNDNVKLMPFKDVLERFKQEVFYHYLWGKSADIEITQIEFGMVREPVKDNPDQYMMLPAWNFIGNINSSAADEKEKSILVLNAIDGSIITDFESIVDPK